MRDDETTAADRRPECSDLLDPAYLGDGRQAFTAATVAAWPEKNRKAMTVQLFTAEQVAAKVAAERERWQALKRKPLTLEQGRAILAEQLLRPASPAGDLDLIRAVERAHGIGA